MPGASWLPIRTEWVPLKSGLGRASLTIYRRDRLPWYRESYIMAAVLEADLLLLRTKLTKLQDIESVNPADAIIRLKPADLCAFRIDEFVPWPSGEAIYGGYSLTDVMTAFRPQHQLLHGLLRSFRNNPVPGWVPINRGALGLSYVYNCTNGLGSLELTANCLYYRSGTVLDNEGLYDRTIVRSWCIYDLNVDEISRQTGDREDAIQARMMARRMRSDAWHWIIRNELPF